MIYYTDINVVEKPIPVDLLRVLNENVSRVVFPEPDVHRYVFSDAEIAREMNQEIEGSGMIFKAFGV
jgi:hypothetical protein